MAAVNGWLLYRRHMTLLKREKKDFIDLLAFISSTAECLVLENKLPARISRRRGRPENVVDSDLSDSDDDNTSIPIPKKRPVVAVAGDQVRYDNVGHLPTHQEPKQRCRICHSYVRMKCMKCNCHLCITKDKNCFVDYHTVK